MTRLMTRLMTRRSIATLVLLAGCARDPALDALHELKDKACACRDQPCVDAALRDLEARTKDLEKSDHPDRARRLGADIMVCLGRARDQAAAAAATDAGTGDAAVAPAADAVPSP